LESVFGYENVYRIGGDEFVAVLENADEELILEYDRKLGEELNKRQGEFILAVAHGYETFDSSKHFRFRDVFRFADEKMYKIKSQMKDQGIASTVFTE
jgi:GGDEF domain-containing protein